MAANSVPSVVCLQAFVGSTCSLKGLCSSVKICERQNSQQLKTIAYGHEERVNPSLQAGERRLVQAGVEGLRRNLVEVDAEGNRSLKGTELIKETVTEIVEIGPKVDVQDDKPLAPAPVAQAAKQEPAKAEAQAEKPEGKQLPSTGEGVDANLLALGLVGVLGGFGLLAQKKKED